MLRCHVLRERIDKSSSSDELSLLATTAFAAASYTAPFSGPPPNIRLPLRMVANGENDAVRKRLSSVDGLDGVLLWARGDGDGGISSLPSRSGGGSGVAVP